jgi:hypothetical protein
VRCSCNQNALFTISSNLCCLLCVWPMLIRIFRIGKAGVVHYVDSWWGKNDVLAILSCHVWSSTLHLHAPCISIIEISICSISLSRIRYSKDIEIVPSKKMKQSCDDSVFWSTYMHCSDDCRSSSIFTCDVTTSININNSASSTLKLILPCLLRLQTRQAFTAEQINEATYVDIHGNKAVFDSLRNNLKVRYDGRRFSYKVKELACIIWHIFIPCFSHLHLNSVYFLVDIV